MRRREPIAVRDLLVWAYRDQMVHAARPEGLPVGLGRREGPRLAAMSFGTDPVDASRGGDFEAAFDAWRVHEAVQSLPDVEWRLSDADLAVLQTRAMIRNAVAGCSGGAGGSVVVAPMRTIAVRSVVFLAAVTDRPPDWCPSPVYRWAHAECGGRQRHGDPIRDGQRHAAVGHYVSAVGFDPWQVSVARRTYTVWVDALLSLRATLHPKLRDFKLTDDLPSANPWQKNRVKSSLEELNKNPAYP